MIAAIARLKDKGFLDSTRRTRPVDDPQPGGQYVEQISNAYFLQLPTKAAQLVERLSRKAAEATARSLTLLERTARQARADRAGSASTAPAAAKPAPEAPSSLMEAIRSLGSAVDRCAADRK